jgi:hypothetical protein
MFSLRSEQVKIANCDRWGLPVYQVKRLLLAIIAVGGPPVRPRSDTRARKNRTLPQSEQAFAAAAFLLPLWLGFLNNRDQQKIEVRKFETDLITKAINQSHDDFDLRNNIHNLLKLGLIKEQQASVRQLLRTKNVAEPNLELCSVP